MTRFLLFTFLLTFFSCGKQTKESKDNSAPQPETSVGLPIEKHSTIPMDTAMVRKLSKKEMKTLFNNRRQIQLGISNEVYQAYTYKNDQEDYYLLLTDHRKSINEEKDTLYDQVYALNVKNNKNTFKKRSTLKGETDGDWETSIGFWNQYSQLSDLDNDGLVDPLIVYGTTGQNGYKDGRVRITAYHKKKRTTIKHQNSEISDGRITKISTKFYNFPIEIQEAVKEKMRLMTKNGHAVFAEGWEKSMKNKAIRLEKM